VVELHETLDGRQQGDHVLLADLHHPADGAAVRVRVPPGSFDEILTPQ